MRDTRRGRSRYWAAACLSVAVFRLTAPAEISQTMTTGHIVGAGNNTLGLNERYPC
jgi:hypothetical protein